MELLNKIQQKLVCKKGQYNDFGKYKYRSCEDILEAVKPLLGKAFLTIHDEIVLIGDRYYVKATVSLTDGDEMMCTSAFARESLVKKGMDESQITGAASSYARKYALNGLFCIDDTKDADTMDNAKEGTTKPTPKIKAPTQKEQAVIDAICEKLKAPEGMEVDAKKVAAILYANNKNKYPSEMERVGTGAAWLEGHKSKEIFKPIEEQRPLHYFCNKCQHEFDAEGLCPECASPEITDQWKGKK